MIDTAQLQRWFLSAQAELRRLEAIRGKGDREVLEAKLRVARANLNQRRRELEKAGGMEA